jgi:hypothetical protein
MYPVMAIFMFACFLFCHRQMHRGFLITLFISNTVNDDDDDNNNNNNNNNVELSPSLPSRRMGGTEV